MTYREFAPPRELANVIECVWTRAPAPASESVKVRALASIPPVTHAILPDGAMDVIATYHPDGELDQTFVVGAMTRPQLATVGDNVLVGIRFLPGTGGSALGTNAGRLTDEHIHVADLFKSTAMIRQAFQSLGTNPASTHALHLCSKAIGMQHRGVPLIVRQATKKLGTHTSPVRIGQIAKELQVSRQHLTRVFSTHAGLTPKLFAQICRVRAMLAVVQMRKMKLRGAAVNSSRTRTSNGNLMTEDSWSMLAVEFGYVDQSHLIAEVQTLVGQTPVAWYASAGSNIPIVPVPTAPL